MAGGLTCDTSIVIAGVSSWHTDHVVARASLRRVSWLPVHVVAESVSVLSRLPHGHAVPLTDAVGVLRRLIAAMDAPPRQLRADRYLRMLDTLGAAGLGGGAVYDGIVAATARENDAMLITLDRRAQRTYAAVGVDFERPS